MAYNRVGHPSIEIVSLVLNKCNLSHRNKRSALICFAYCMGKIHKLPYPPFHNLLHNTLEANPFRPLGPALILSPVDTGIIHFMDTYSWFTWIFMLEQKSEALQAFIKFKIQV